MACVTFDRVTMRFGPTVAVDSISLDIPKGEFIALLGPSGCGKTTVLRLIAGFETPDEGTVVLNGRVVGAPGIAVPPEERGLGMVFQSYALWPHMSVAENIAFALKVRRMARADREARVAEALALVGLEGMGGRRPHQLSGGQRQRVALARCLAMRPRIVLLDEPLANLDAHLREAMQREFRRIHAETGAAFVYVTHDQAEALSLADRVAVMNEGRLQQLGTPADLYRHPTTEMVARFVGRGMVVPVEVSGRNGEGMHARLFGHEIVARGEAPPGVTVPACLRAEDLAISDGGEGTIPARVVEASFQGATTSVTAAIEGLNGHGPVELRVVHSGPTPAVGARVGIRVHDAWLIPGDNA